MLEISILRFGEETWTAAGLDIAASQERWGGLVCSAAALCKDARTEDFLFPW